MKSNEMEIIENAMKNIVPEMKKIIDVLGKEESLDSTDKKKTFNQFIFECKMKSGFINL